MRWDFSYGAVHIRGPPREPYAAKSAEYTVSRMFYCNKKDISLKSFFYIIKTWRPTNEKSGFFKLFLEIKSQALGKCRVFLDMVH
jgi:hypothetical protein